MAEIRFYAQGVSNTEVSDGGYGDITHEAGSGLGFFGSTIGVSVPVGDYQTIYPDESPTEITTSTTTSTTTTSTTTTTPDAAASLPECGDGWAELLLLELWQH